MRHPKPRVRWLGVSWAVQYLTEYGECAAYRATWRQAMDFAIAVAASCPWNPR